MTKPREVCSGPPSRRSFLQAGMLGLSGLGLSDFLRLRAEGNSGQRVPPDTAVILVWLPGGLSHIDTYDMKPNAPLEYRGEFRPIRTVVPPGWMCASCCPSTPRWPTASASFGPYPMGLFSMAAEPNRC